MHEESDLRFDGHEGHLDLLTPGREGAWLFAVVGEVGSAELRGQGFPHGVFEFVVR